MSCSSAARPSAEIYGEDENSSLLLWVLLLEATCRLRQALLNAWHVQTFLQEISIVNKKEKQAQEIKKMKPQFFGTSFETEVGISWITKPWDLFKFSKTEENEMW